MRRIIIAISALAALFCIGSVPTTRAGAQVLYCPPLPYWYPRGWELMIRRGCQVWGYQPLPYGYGPTYQSYYRAGLRPFYRTRRPHRRPYLRPGWWW